MTETKTEYLSKLALKGRGWTEASIRLFLGDPDQLGASSRYGTRAHLYATERVEVAEASEAYIRWSARSATRSQAAQGRAARKQYEMYSWVEAVQIEIPMYATREDLEAAATPEVYEQMWRDGISVEGISIRLLPGDLVSYLKDREYGRCVEILESLFGRGLETSPVRDRLERRILLAIASRYEYLSSSVATWIRHLDKQASDAEQEAAA